MKAENITESELIERLKELRLEKMMDKVFLYFQDKYGAHGNNQNFFIDFPTSFNISLEYLKIIEEMSHHNYFISVVNNGIELKINKDKTDFIKDKLIF